MDSIEKLIIPEKDAFYLMGEERAETRFMQNLLIETDMEDQRIAKLAGVSVEFVEQVRQKMTPDK